MRTTLTVSDDIDLELREIARIQGRTYKDVLNEALRKGLQYISTQKPPGQFVIESFDCRFLPGIDTGKLNQLSDEMESLQ